MLDALNKLEAEIAASRAALRRALAVLRHDRECLAASARKRAPAAMSLDGARGYLDHEDALAALTTYDTAIYACERVLEEDRP